MSSFEGVRATELLAYNRCYFDIGSSCHWVLDAVYREDHNQPRDRISAAKGDSRAMLIQYAYKALKQLPSGKLPLGDWFARLWHEPSKSWNI